MIRDYIDLSLRTVKTENDLLFVISQKVTKKKFRDGNAFPSLKTHPFLCRDCSERLFAGRFYRRLLSQRDEFANWLAFVVRQATSTQISVLLYLSLFLA